MDTNSKPFINIYTILKSTALSLYLCLCLNGCGGKENLKLIEIPETSATSVQQKATDLLSKDPAGPIVAPNIPESLRTTTQKANEGTQEIETESQIQREPLTYTVISESPEAPEVSSTFLTITSLNRLQETPIYSVTSLRQRLRTSIQEGLNVLNSLGYYAGTVQGEVQRSNRAPQISPKQQQSAPQKIQDAGQSSQESNLQPATRPSMQQEDRRTQRSFTVLVNFEPGVQYVIGRTTVVPVDPIRLEPLLYQEDEEEETKELQPKRNRSRIPPVPKSLEDVDLAKGAPAIAADITAATERVKAAFRNRGYPDAEIASTRYIADHNTHTLDAEIRILPGEFARMGNLRIEGAEDVSNNYIEALRRWRLGRVWNQDQVEFLREDLRASGLFSNIELERAKEADTKGRSDLVVKLESAPKRTVGGSVKYDSDFGPGIEGFWEHRNLTGSGDSLRLEAPIWADMQEATAKYRLPFFLDNRQDFIAQAGVLNQDINAYEIQSMAVAAGIERRLNRLWRISAMGSLEGGRLKDPDQPSREYLMTGLPLSVTYSSANSLLNATRGTRLILSTAPYIGTYDNAFNVARTRVDIQHFLPVISTADKFILALRGSVGSLFGAKAYKVPPSIRFYSGGGGSVRGYEYQSIGPQNEHDDPLGGDSLVEFSIEPRWKINDLIGLVAFLDGGMVYESLTTDYNSNMLFGAGVGIRLYTAVGPVRFDVATPLNPRSSDKPLQFYISIGQSF